MRQLILIQNITTSYHKFKNVCYPYSLLKNQSRAEDTGKKLTRMIVDSKNEK